MGWKRTRDGKGVIGYWLSWSKGILNFRLKLFLAFSLR